MDSAIVSRLLELNKQFYQTFALHFSATRRRLQPGVMRVLDDIHPNKAILDLGCGNGELAAELARRGHRGLYTGLDLSQELLDLARATLGDDTPFQYNFLWADLSDPQWDESLPGSTFDVILAFAVLHHLPGMQLRERVLTKIRDHLNPQGCFIHSVWQFLNSPRLQARIQPWEKIGLSARQVDAGDYLLDWRHGGYGLRYVHHFTMDELDALAQRSAFRVEKTYYSDGERGNLGLYQVWRPRDI